MTGTITQFVDFTSNTAGDTGENNAEAIQPYVDGEAVTAAVLGRPPEGLRQRTEALRNVFTDTLYLRDADRGLLITGPGKITWPGSTTVAASGIPVITDTVWILPMLTPGYAQTPPVPPVASAFGTVYLKRASDSTNALVLTSTRRSYAAGDQINVTVIPGAAFSVKLDAEDGYQRTITIVATGATTLAMVITEINTNGACQPVAPDSGATIVTAALYGGAAGGDLLLDTQARQYVSGNYDGEGHTITPANLASFFASNPTSALAEGDTLCVAYAMVVDTGSTGGRRQALPENTNTSIPAGSFFNSRIHPDKLANALPICKVVNGSLVFATGVEIAAASTAAPLYGAGAANITYAGGATWADGTTNPATTVEAQLDKIVTDLAGAAGTAKIQGVVVGTDLAAGTLKAQIDNLAANWWKLSRGNTDSAANTFSGINTFTNANVFSGANAFSGDNTFTGPQEYQGDFLSQLGVTEQLDRGGLHSPVGSRFFDDFYELLVVSSVTGAMWTRTVSGTGAVSQSSGSSCAHAASLSGAAAADAATLLTTGPTVRSWPTAKPMWRARVALHRVNNSIMRFGLYDNGGGHQIVRFIQDPTTYGNNNLRVLVSNTSNADTAVDTAFVPVDNQFYWYWIVYSSATTVIWRISDLLTGSLQASGTATVGSGALKTDSANLFFACIQDTGTATMLIDCVETYQTR